MYPFHYSSLSLSVLLPSCFCVLAFSLSYWKLAFTVADCQALQTFMVGDESWGFNCNLPTALSAQQCFLIEHVGAYWQNFAKAKSSFWSLYFSIKAFSTTEALSDAPNRPTADHRPSLLSYKGPFAFYEHIKQPGLLVPWSGLGSGFRIVTVAVLWVWIIQSLFAVINNTQETQLCKFLQNCKERDEPWDLDMQRQKRLSEGDR